MSTLARRLAVILQGVVDWPLLTQCGAPLAEGAES